MSINKPSQKLSSVKAPNQYVLAAPRAASDGLGREAREVLSVLNTSPIDVAMHPRDVRAKRQREGNPFDHNPVQSLQKLDISIPSGEGELNCRMYGFAGAEEPLRPALVYFHGGGFVLGSIESYDRFLSQLAFQSKVLVISVGYRLAPETRFPGALADAKLAFNWFHERASEFGIDRSRLAIGGDSAGANLAVVTCRDNRDSGGPMPALQLLIYPSVIGNKASGSREEFSEGLYLTKEIITWFHDHYIDRDIADDPRFNLLAHADHSRLPPAFIMTAGFDPLRDEGFALAQTFQKNQVAVRHSCYTDMFHGFINFGSLSQARAAVSECAEVLSACLLADAATSLDATLSPVS
jgi:acetyl esterase